MKASSVLACALALFTLLNSCSQKGRKEIPILAWYSIPDGEFATLERYQELKDAGFTISFSHTGSFEGAMKALDLCAEVGIKSVFTCPELESSPEETVRKVMNHPGLGYYFLRDEPWDDAMPPLGEWARRIEAVDASHPCYLNLFPYHSGGFASEDRYREHIRLFSDKVALPQISYDHYPILDFDGKVSLNPLYYANLEMISAEARRTGKPFWAFALATAHMHYPIPDIGHLRLQMYADLAYGAQCLQYFTYWNPGTETWDFHEAPIKADGQRSPVYELIREFNREIQDRAEIFSGCSVKKVSHVGREIPTGTTRLAELPSGFKGISCEDGALVSEIENAGKDYVVLQNTSPSKEIHLCLRFDDNTLIVRRDGSRVKASKYGPLFIITAGDILVFEIRK